MPNLNDIDEAIVRLNNRLKKDLRHAVISVVLGFLLITFLFVL